MGRRGRKKASLARGHGRVERPRPRGALSPLGTFLAISPDGKLLATMTRHVSTFRGQVIDAAGGSLDLWAISTGKHARQLAGSASRLVRGASTRPASSSLPATGHFCTKRMTNASVRARFMFSMWPQANYGLVPLSTEAWALALSPDGRTAYLGGVDGTIRAVDITTGETRLSLTGHHDTVMDLVVLACGRRHLSHPAGTPPVCSGTWRAPPRPLPRSPPSPFRGETLRSRGLPHRLGDAKPHPFDVQRGALHRVPRFVASSYMKVGCVPATHPASSSKRDFGTIQTSLIRMTTCGGLEPHISHAGNRPEFQVKVHAAQT